MNKLLSTLSATASVSMAVAASMRHGSPRLTHGIKRTEVPAYDRKMREAIEVIADRVTGQKCKVFFSQDSWSVRVDIGYIHEGHESVHLHCRRGPDSKWAVPTLSAPAARGMDVRVAKRLADLMSKMHDLAHELSGELLPVHPSCLGIDCKYANYLPQ